MMGRWEDGKSPPRAFYFSIIAIFTVIPGASAEERAVDKKN